MNPLKYLFAPVQLIRERPLLCTGIALGGLALSVYCYKRLHREQQLPEEDCSTEDTASVRDDHEDHPALMDETFVFDEAPAPPVQQQYCLTPAGEALLKELQAQEAFFVMPSPMWLSKARRMLSDDNLSGQVESSGWQIVPYRRTSAPIDMQQTRPAYKLSQACQEMLQMLQELDHREFLPTGRNDHRIALGGLALSVYCSKRLHREQQLPEEDCSTKDTASFRDDHEDHPALIDETFVFDEAPAPPAQQQYCLTPAGEALLKELQAQETFFVTPSPMWLSKARKMLLDDNLSGQVESPGWQIVPYRRTSAPIDMQQTRPAYKLSQACQEMLQMLQELDRRGFLPTGRNNHRSQTAAAPAAQKPEPVTTTTESSEFQDVNLPLMGSWWAHGWRGGERFRSPLQRWEDAYSSTIIVRRNVTELWLSHIIKLDLLGSINPLTTVMTQEVTGIQIRNGAVEKMTCFRCESRTDFDTTPHTPLAEVTTTFLGFEQTGALLNVNSWSETYNFVKKWDEPEAKESPFMPPSPPSPGPSPPPPPGQWEAYERAMAAEAAAAEELPNIYAQQQYRGIMNIGAKVAALRCAFQGENTTLCNYLTVAARMIIGGLAELNNKDVQAAQFSFDKLVSYIMEQENRQALDMQLANAGIHHVNLVDILFELVLHRALGSEQAVLNPSFGRFFELLLSLMITMFPSLDAGWTRDGRRYAQLIQERLLDFLDTMFSLEEEVFECPEWLEQNVQSNLETEVELLMDWLN